MNRQNPFPGMNPFMERTWSDVQLSLMAQICDLMGKNLPDDLLARAELSINMGAASHVPSFQMKWRY